MTAAQSIGYVRPAIVLLVLWLVGCIPAVKCERTFSVLGFISQTVGGRPIANLDVVASYVASVLAVKHFNERDARVLAVMSSLGKCDARLSLAGGGLFDDQVLSSVAMKHLIRTVANETVDFINGPLSADVSFANMTYAVTKCSSRTYLAAK